MQTLEMQKQQLVRLTADMLRLLEEAEDKLPWQDAPFSRWRTTCQTITAQLSHETMRVAVVGAIKSGKSTLVNALIGGDFLKRGAGVVTSIVTRVRTGERLRAILRLKTWDEINREINEASVLLPGLQPTGGRQFFDLRLETDREILSQALSKLAADQLIVNGTRSPGSVLLGSYLNGYAEAQQWVETRASPVIFEGQRFGLHRDFVGNDALAVYLTDLSIEIDTEGIGKDVEIADCQGSDSPNPFHLAMIQDYLTVAHLTIYVISSRTGIRRADIRFLTMIRKMGILDTVVFVVNCDLGEHESTDALVSVVKRIESELKIICRDASIFTFSSLFTLLSQTQGNLTAKDRNRLSHWRLETEMIDFVEEERKRFLDVLHGKINLERGTLLLKNNLDRLEVVGGGVANWVALQRERTQQQTNGTLRLAGRIHTQKGHLEQTRRTLKNTLDGALLQIKRNLKTAVDTFFNAHEKGVVDGIVRFIRSYEAAIPPESENPTEVGFASRLYLVFQAFKQALDAHMAESVTPAILRFVREQETALVQALDEITSPFGTLIEEAVDSEEGEVKAHKAGRQAALPPIRIAAELSSIRKMAGISLPPAAATMQYSAQMKTEAVMRFGLYKIVNFVKKLVNKSVDKGRKEFQLALASGVKRMKKETERSVRFHMKDYQENIKFQYLLKLADAAADALYRQMVERFQYYGADLSKRVEQIGEQGVDNKRLAALLDRMASQSKDLQERIAELKGTFG